MSSKHRLAGLSALLLAALAAPPAAFADEKTAAKAQALFSEGLSLMRSGRAAEACPKLEESERLDPGMGTEFRLAECYEGTGRVASAFVMFGGVAESASRAGKPDRAEQARARAEALRVRLSTLTLVVPPELVGLSGLELRRDGLPILRSDWGRAIPLDPAEHVVTATAPGKPVWERRITLAERAAIELKVPPFAGAPGPAPTPPRAEPQAPVVDPAPPRAGLGGQRATALGVGAAGVVGLVIGTAFGAVAGARWSESKDGHCTSDKVPRCDAQGVELARSAATSATASTVGFAVGGAALVGAAVLWFTAPARKPQAQAIRWSPTAEIGPSGGGLRVEGRF